MKTSFLRFTRTFAIFFGCALISLGFGAAHSSFAQQGPPQQAAPAGAPAVGGAQGAAPAGRGGPGGGPGAPGRGGNPLPTAAEMKGKIAVLAFKNIQVLANIPAEEVLPSMGYITAALGVRCDHCHVQGQFDSDEKPPKNAARAMMRMVASINGGTFNGQRAVTCYTCHRGSSTPVTTPTVAMAAAQPSPGPAAGQGGGRGGPGGPGGPGAGVQEAPAAPPGPPMPSINVILAKYTDALGGSAAIQKLTSRVATGTVMQGPGQPNAVEESRKGSDMATSTTHTPRGDNMQGYNGTDGWSANAFMGSADTTGDALVRLREWAEFFPGIDMKRSYPRIEVDGVEQIDGHDVYRVLAYREDTPDRFYFDKDSGLLLRFYTRIESTLGDLPQETSYEDYRAVGGAKVPFTVRVAGIQNTAVYKWDKIEANAAPDDSRFAKPNITPQPPSPGGAGPGRGGAGGPGGQRPPGE